MEYMQFTAVVLMTLLTLKLLLLPGKVSVNPAANKSRWMMMAGWGWMRRACTRGWCSRATALCPATPSVPR